MANLDRPAFPQPIASADGAAPWTTEIPGLTIRQQAAVTLRVPDSGDAALDRMIREARRLDAAEAAMQGLMASGPYDCEAPGIAHDALLYADALLAAVRERTMSPGSKIIAGTRDAVAMARADTLETLAARCEAGESGRLLDAEVDVAIGTASAREGTPVELPSAFECCEAGTYWRVRGGKSLRTSPSLTTSLDAVAALQEAVLPGWAVYANREYIPTATAGRSWSSEVYKIGADVFIQSEAPTLPLAWLAAILRAKAAEIRKGEASR